MMGKLVRDLIPQVIRDSGREPIVRVLEPNEYEIALHDKLLEEAAELRAATADERIAEAADVLEVLQAIARHHGFTLDDIIQAAKVKVAARGGFSHRVWLEAAQSAGRGEKC